MFKDKQEALERLDQLLQEIEPEQEMEKTVSFECDTVETEPAEEPVVYHNYANRYGRIYNSDITDRDLEAYSQEVYEPKKQSDILALSILALALATAIIGVVIWWILRYL